MYPSTDLIAIFCISASLCLDIIEFPCSICANNSTTDKVDIYLTMTLKGVFIGFSQVFHECFQQTITMQQMSEDKFNALLHSVIFHSNPPTFTSYNTQTVNPYF